METNNSSPIIIANVSTSMFSVARHYGGMKFGGKTYVYKPERDILIREDWDNAYRHLEWNTFIDGVKAGVKPAIPKKESRKQAKQAIEDNTKSLFD